MVIVRKIKINGNNFGPTGNDNQSVCERGFQTLHIHRALLKAMTEGSGMSASSVWRTGSRFKKFYQVSFFDINSVCFPLGSLFSSALHIACQS